LKSNYRGWHCAFGMKCGRAVQCQPHRRRPCNGCSRCSGRRRLVHRGITTVAL